MNELYILILYFITLQLDMIFGKNFNVNIILSTRNKIIIK